MAHADNRSLSKLKPVLDRFYSEFDFEGRIAHDPIEFPRSYSRREDQEVAGLIASCFAYGSVGLFKTVVRELLLRMDGAPGDFLRHYDVRRDRGLFAGIKYRFNDNRDILAFFLLIGRLLKRHGSLERAFMMHYNSSEDGVRAGLTGFVDELLEADTFAVYGSPAKPAGLLQLLPSPRKGGAAKRLNLYLRWMVRDRDIDLGIWKGIPKSRLIIPLDLHIARIGKCLGLTGRATADWKMAQEITDSLRQLDPEDPLKYDFALCHQGISRACSRENCSACVLKRKGVKELKS